MRKSSHRELGADATVLVQCRDLKLVSSRDWSCGHLLRESIAVGMSRASGPFGMLLQHVSAGWEFKISTSVVC